MLHVAGNMVCTVVACRDMSPAQVGHRGFGMGSGGLSISPRAAEALDKALSLA